MGHAFQHGTAQGAETVPVVSAKRGVMIRSMVGSSARFMKRAVRCMAPLCAPHREGRDCSKRGALAYLLEICLEKPSCFHVNSHGTEHNGKVVFVVVHCVLALHKASLTRDLGTNLHRMVRRDVRHGVASAHFIMRETCR